MELKNNEIATKNQKGETIVVKIVYKGEKNPRWGNEFSNSDYSSQHHKVYVRNTNTGRRTSFDSWSSQRNPKMENRQGALEALCSFAVDADAAVGSFQEFCLKFGYDEDSRTAWNTFKACISMRNKFERVIGVENIEDFMQFDCPVDHFIAEGTVMTEC